MRKLGSKLLITRYFTDTTQCQRGLFYALYGGHLLLNDGQPTHQKPNIFTVELLVALTSAAAHTTWSGSTARMLPELFCMAATAQVVVPYLAY